MGSVTAKIVRNRRLKRKMGIGGAGGGSESAAVLAGEGAFEGGYGPEGLGGLPDGNAIGGPDFLEPPPVPVEPVPDDGGYKGFGPPPEPVPEPEPEEKKPVITRAKRRRSILTEEEGGVLRRPPVSRRSLLGR